MASMPLMAATDLASLSLYATTVSTENCLSASLTLMVPMADDRRPEKGNTSGERLHCTLIFTRPTMVDSVSRSPAASVPSGDAVKSAACCPFQDLRSADLTWSRWPYDATGITGPNCSSWKRRISGVTGYTMAGLGGWWGGEWGERK